MEIIAVLVMIAAGGATAIFALLAFTIARHERRHAGTELPASRDEIAVSILHQILVAGGMPSDAALRHIRRFSGLAAPVTRDVDVASWGESFVRASSDAQRATLLETAVQLISSRQVPVPLLQYCALLDLSFALGFHTDALARLREQYGFEYVDHAKSGRPREADRAGGATALFMRDHDLSDPRELLRVLEIDTAKPTRQGIISAYRRLAALYHPDKVSDRSPLAQETAAARFIELTRAYERLMALYRD